MNTLQITANLVDIPEGETYPAVLDVENGIIKKITPLDDTAYSALPYLIPGFIDAHVHVESSMLVPSEFARLAVVHGTVATVSDPHEIANVCGEKGLRFMLENGKKVPFKFFFGAPSCVPATTFETAGATLDAAAVEKLLQQNDILYLSEMMNFPGVLQGNGEVMEKIAAARKAGKPIDGHAPGLRGDEARRYAEAGVPGDVVISTDHECFTREEAQDKLDAGMKIIIREGSAARNFDALIDLLKDYPDRIMFCSDDKHPDSLVEGHIDALVKRALAKEIPLFNVLKAACVNPVAHYGLPVGLLREGDPADFILLRNLKTFEVLETYVNGEKVAEQGKTLIASVPVTPVNQFNCSEKRPDDFKISREGISGEVQVIEAVDGALITGKTSAKLPSEENALLPDPANDILKIAVVNRYKDSPPAVAFVKNFGLKNGAIASSVAHDSHNIIAVGCDDDALCKAVNIIIRNKGGISAVHGAEERILSLPVAGLMSADDGYEVAKSYAALDRMAKEMGSKLRAPFMTLSFMALLVIPHLKLSDKGLFDGDRFALTDLS